MTVNLIEINSDLIWFVLAAYGLTQILVYSKVFEKIRPNRDQWGLIGYMANCSMCMGFWVGMFLFFINGFTELFTFDYNIGNMFVCGWISSGTSYFLSMLLNDEGLKIQGSKTTCECSTTQRSKL
jgi:hypothetical protein